MKKCPYCSREIEDQATTCCFCGHPLDKPSITPAQTIARLKRGQKSRWAWVILTLIAIVIIVGYLLLSHTIIPNGNSQDVWHAGETILRVVESHWNLSYL